MAYKPDHETSRNIFFTTVFTAVYVFCSIWFGLIHIASHRYENIGYIEIVFASILLINGIFLLLSKALRPAKIIFFTAVGFLLIYILFFGNSVSESLSVITIHPYIAYLVYVLLSIISIHVFFYESYSEKLFKKHLMKKVTTEVTPELTQKIRELEVAQTTMSKLLKELNSERAKDGAILSSIGEGVIATDDTGKIIFINPKAETMLGVRLIQVMNKPIDSVYTELNDKQVILTPEERPVWKTLHSGKSVSDGTIMYATSDKKQFPVFTSVSPIILNGKTIGAINVFRDITHEKDVDRMKTEFISLASHQLRTPLAAIKWFLQILQDGDVGNLTDEQRDIVMNIYQSNERMIDLVNSLLNVSRIESGRIIIEPTETDITQLVQGIITELQPKLTEKKIRLTFQPAADLPIIIVDKQLIRQVYLNLLTNAIKYTPDGGTITITLSKNDTNFISEVADSGYGIPEKDKEKVFSKFYRGENIAKFDTDGNGLGLYLIKEIIDASDGTISYTSVENQGTTFTFTIPLSGMQAKKGEVTLT